MIAAVAGHAVAGGLELACWCDLRVVEEDAVLGVFCRRLGVPLIDGGTVRLPRIVGLGRALDLILTGRAVGAEEALRIGLATASSRAARRAPLRRSSPAQLAEFPQPTMRADRCRSTAGSASRRRALAQEFARGSQVLDEARRGAERFAAGEGRHGTV